MKKHLFLTILAATTAAFVTTGCGKNEVAETIVPEAESYMEFSPVVGKQTRATEISSADLKKNGTVLNLYGYKVNGTFSGRTDIAPFFDGTPEPLKYDGGWATSKKYEWSGLGENGKLNIFTFFSPKNVLTGITAPTQSKAASFSYTIPTTIADQEDLLVAANLDMTKSSTKGLINISFKHALSQLYFKAKLTAEGHKAVIK